MPVEMRAHRVVDDDDRQLRIANFISINATVGATCWSKLEMLGVEHAVARLDRSSGGTIWRRRRRRRRREATTQRVTRSQRRRRFLSCAHANATTRIGTIDVSEMRAPENILQLT